jgi:arabinogalactan oligomer/maltooligosaccharide transport system permease protein
MRKNDYFEKNDSIPKIVAIYFILIVACILCVYPLLSMLAVALRPGNQLYSTSLWFIPSNATLDNFAEAFKRTEFFTAIKNSVIISLLCAVISLVLGTSCAYAFSRFKFKGKSFGLMLLLVTQMFPATMLLLPLSIMLSHLNLNDNLLGLLVMYLATALPFCIWLLKGYFDTIPYSLEESAYVDGAGLYRTYFSIILPLAKPALAIGFLFGFMNAWSEYIVARTVITSTDKSTLPMMLVSLSGQYHTEWGIYASYTLITSIPVMILFMALSKYLVGGLTSGSVKG